ISTVLCVMLAIGLPCPGPLANAMSEAADSQPNVKDAYADDRLFSFLQERDHYSSYIAQHQGAARPNQEIRLEAGDYTRLEGEGFAIVEHYEGQSGTSVLTGEKGMIEWSVQIPETGLYHMSLLYYPVEGKSSSIERMLLIDGEL